MSNSPDLVAHVLELMRPTAQVTARSMFGGHGLYAGGVFFAILDDDTLYLKCDDTNRAKFDALDLPRFVYSKDGKDMSMSYRRAPDEALDSAAAMRPWLRLALGAALRSAAAKVKPKRAPETATTKTRIKRGKRRTARSR